MTTTETKPLGQPRRLTCACCGESCIGRQWWNRDTGYGLCRDCIPRHLEAYKRVERMTDEEAEAELRLSFGIRGVHFDIPGT